MAPFDIFRADEGRPLWLGTFDSLEEAKTRVQVIGKKRPGTFWIINTKNEDKEVVKVDGSMTTDRSDEATI